MTDITNIPFLKDDDGFGIAPLIVTAVLVNSNGALLDTQQRFEIDIYSKPQITLDQQPFNTGWRINTRQADITYHKSVVINTTVESWDTLTEVDETTLHPIPTGEAKAAWDAFLTKLATVKGDKGDTGAKGDTGPKGEPGDAGSSIKGDKGEKGDPGVQGIQGVKGDTGAQGVKGNTGDTGPRGLQGIQGNPGNDGATGAQGIQGVQGPAGARGMVGPAGLTWQGVYDNTHDYVQNDAVYYSGASWFATYDPPLGQVPSETSSYWSPLSLRGVKGDTGAQGVQGVKGDAGSPGATGAQGIQGVKGDTGSAGAQGIQGVKGDTGAAGAAGAAGATGAQGPQGIQGVKGDTGAAAPNGDTAWTNIVTQNGYATDAQYASPQFRKLGSGLVILKGFVTTPSNATAYQAVANLPAGYRPAKTQFFSVSRGDNYGSISIGADGNIVYRSGVASSWIGLDSVRFYAEA